MNKKILLFPVIIVLFLAFSLPSFAYTNDIHDARAKSTLSDTIVTITRPDGDETTFDNDYVICGVTSKKRVTVKLLRYDWDSGDYVDFENIDGQSSWTIGTSRVFMKEIRLPSDGANKIRIVCYQGNNDNQCQLEDFTITVLKESFKDVIKKGFMNFTQVMKYIFR